MIHLNKISMVQLFCLVILTQVGVHILTIPSEESRHSGHDAWMSVLVGGVIAQLVIMIIYWLGTRHPHLPMPQYIISLVGKPIGIVLNLIIAVYCLESSLLVVVSYADVINRWVLYATPWIVQVGLLTAIAGYVASSTLRSIAAVTQIVMVMFLFCFVIIFISGLGKGEILHIFPIGSHGFGAIMKDSLPAFWAYAGYELLLYVFPYVKRKNKRSILFIMSAANGFTTLFYVLISIIVTFSFSENQLKAIPEPMIFILRQFHWPVLQNLDIVFITVWLSVTTVTVYVYLFLSARYLAFVHIQEIRNHSFLVWILAILCFAAAIWGADRQRILQFSAYHNTASILIVAVLPAMLLLISLARGRRAGFG
ncbi:GerAB/ArcD/ProY family transporter [Paenibacillus kobensis]|uniref:GerAB/ArcD/ProY family transporter n=1 Tax=Paenibacillus kobensis TaxID=59841 RepID=UPI000FD7AE65|nr:GerAB/ArcD/ProY family transporter [Paenibacillus kobensis]